MEYQFDENTITEAYDSTPEEVKELLMGTEITSSLFEIGGKYSLSEVDVDPLIKEIGYVLLGLQARKENYSDFIKENVEGIQKCSNTDRFTKEVNSYFKLMDEKALRFTPMENKYGDEVIYAAMDPDKFYITKDYFRVWDVDKYPHSYVRRADVVSMSGFQELGFTQSITFIIFALILAGISISCLASGEILFIIFGVLGFWGFGEVGS